MVRCATFEIRWHDTLPIYACDFQPIPPPRLAKVLDHNLGQAAGLPPGHMLPDSSTDQGSSGAPQAPLQAGGQSWRLATAGGDNNVRLWMVHPNIPSPAAVAAATTDSRPHPPRTEYLSTLSRHTGVVNVVRFSPAGDVLASAGDDGNVLFWVRSDRMRAFGEGTFGAPEADTEYEKESWRVRLMTRATSLELYDLAWSPDGASLVVGGTDFVARIINATDGSVLREISEHQHYVQGVAWDPRSELLATQSSDRSVHVYRLLRGQGKAPAQAISGVQLASRSSKLDAETAREQGVEAPEKPADDAARSDDHPAAGDRPATGGQPAHESQPGGSSTAAPPSPTSSVPPLPTIRPPPTRRERATAASGTTQKLYGDDRYSGFFRRLCWSPDGALLATPSGQYVPVAGAGSSAVVQSQATSSAVYLYARGNLAQSHSPVAALPGYKSVALVVRFSPILYKLRKPARHGAADGERVGGSFAEPRAGPPEQLVTSIFCLPYRMVYAVATQESVWVYDTQQSSPLYCFSNLHYAPFTDLAWSPDGQTLVMSSSDGYCSVAVFDYNELGSPYVYSEQPSLMQRAAEAGKEHAGQAEAPANTTIPAASEAGSSAPLAAAASSASSTDALKPPPQGTDTKAEPKVAESEQAAEQPPADAARPAANAPATSDTCPAAAPAPGPSTSTPQPGAVSEKGPKKRRVALTFEGPLRQD